MSELDLYRARGSLSYADLWCGEAALRSFGIEVEHHRYASPTYLARVVNRLRTEGWQLAQAVLPWNRPGSRRPTLGRFIQEHQQGDWLIYTADHIMSLRDGVLTDTDLDGGPRRRIKMAWLVTRPRTGSNQ